MSIQMVDLKSQYLKIKNEIDSALISCVESTNYIKGPKVKLFEEILVSYLNANHLIAPSYTNSAANVIRRQKSLGLRRLSPAGRNTFAKAPILSKMIHLKI